ncbi:hypothetical protein DEIGR_400048 [Deinococcus grandis]|uniref:TM2 domain-containing protein n=1 Tax=Deinococcus grandis TaxID=57498 RepID=A0A100HQL5_9DEIO|nr:NINE protein [Deinococcus grandis]GAQ23915.1 hypothetical protein DEIGR_400048 [Deinococcus grandis]
MTQDQNLALAQQMYLSQQKNVTVYVLLALLLGGLGVHHFYLGRTTPGLLHLLLCWTLVPSVLAVAHAINGRKAVRDRNTEIARHVATTLGAPVDPLLKMAMI